MNAIPMKSYILLVDDHAIILEGLQLLLQQMFEVEVETASSLQHALTHDDSPFVIILDLMLPEVDGYSGIKALQQKWPQAKIMILSSKDDYTTQQDAIDNGAFAFISKSSNAAQVADIIASILQENSEQKHSSNHQLSLTLRQYEVLNLINQGMGNKLIAKQLSISGNTVRRHLQDIFSLLNVSSRTEAIFVARQKGLIP
jgi:DNA-binding NarL/FixJ family response regulator